MSERRIKKAPHSRKRVSKVEDDAIGRTSVLLKHAGRAVVQGLSEAPFMHDVKHWGVMTIGSGLGNARFTNH
jgi:hypothetical protein